MPDYIQGVNMNKRIPGAPSPLKQNGNSPKIQQTYNSMDAWQYKLSRVRLFCNPMDCIPPGSSVCEILQARILEWAAISSSRGSSQPRDQPWSPALASVFFATARTVTPLAPLSMGFSRQEYWSGLPFPPPGEHPNPGIKPESPALAGWVPYH